VDIYLSVLKAGYGMSGIAYKSTYSAYFLLFRYASFIESCYVCTTIW